MGKIGRIQLRGISRTPSDRLTEDGGCAESLNVQLDNTELAPSFIPEDVTKKLGLPDDLQAEKVFVHKTANYENYIVELTDRIVAYTPDIEDEEPLLVYQKSEGESIKSITSIGNTLIIGTQTKMYYALYKDRVYSFLDKSFPVPVLDIYAEPEDQEYQSASLDLDFRLNDYDTKEQWNSSSDEYLISLTEKVWESNPNSLKDTIVKELSNGYFVSPRFFQCVIELNEGSPVVSLPVLVGSGPQFMPYVKSYWRRFIEEDQYGDPTVRTTTESYIYYRRHKVKAILRNLKDFEPWKDIITNIKIYVGEDLYLKAEYKKENKLNLHRLGGGESQDGKEEEIFGDLYLDDSLPTIEEMLEKEGITYLCRTYPMSQNNKFSKEIEELANGIIIDASEEFQSENLVVKDRLIPNDFTNYPIFPVSVDNYNNRLIAISPTYFASYMHHGLGATLKNDAQKTIYEIYFKCKGVTKDVTFKTDIIAADIQYCGLIFCPEVSCEQMIIKATRGENIRYRVVKAVPHPNLPCAYASLSNSVYYSEDLFDSLGEEEKTLPVIDSVSEKENSIWISPVNEPFVFPANSKYTFQSKVIGIAIATTALSQGQFGQFPLYVFTEDGIWAMETAADGSFVTSKPLSRDVCVNPDSITSIDSAVVFVSDTGVMLLQGSQVVNISPYMNGRHYVVENTAKTIIEGQDFFCDLLPTISDKTHFLAFVKNASVAYDYAGKRLVFIKDDEAYQYVYKLDTQTWHKTAYGINLVAPINSYPGCLVQGSMDGKTRFYDLSTLLDAQESGVPARGIIATRPFDLGEPDILKTITDIRIRGQFPKGAVKFILLGSNDGINFYTLSTLRGKSWKLFRMIILADLAPTDRISWVDIMYDTKFTNRLR